MQYNNILRLKSFLNLVNLTSLDISMTSSEMNYENLRKLTNLTFLNASESYIHNSDIIPLTNLSSLYFLLYNRRSF